MTENTPTKPKRALTLELDEDDVRNLAVLAPAYAVEDDDDVETRAREALYELCDRIFDGVRRPQSWERSWLVKALGDDWLEHLEPDPDGGPYRQRPKPRPTPPTSPTGEEPGGAA